MGMPMPPSMGPGGPPPTAMGPAPMGTQPGAGPDPMAALAAALPMRGRRRARHGAKGARGRARRKAKR